MATHRTFIATYIMASGRNGTLYTGMTSNLFARVWKHKTRSFTGFTDDQRRAFWLIKEELVKNREYAKVRFHETGTKDVPLLPVFLQVRPKEDMTK